MVKCIYIDEGVVNAFFPILILNLDEANVKSMDCDPTAQNNLTLN